MADPLTDNTRLPVGTEDGDTYASDAIAGVKWQRVKVCFGGDGSATDCSIGDPLPVTCTGTVAVSGSVAVTNAALAVVGEGAKAIALRVALANDMTSVVKVDGSAVTQPVSGTVAVSGTVPVSIAAAGASTGTQTSVGDSASSVTVLASNAARLGAMFTNASSATLYLLFVTGGTATTTTAYSVPLPSGAFYELPLGHNGKPYSGAVQGIWASDSGGYVNVTEFTA